MRSHIYWAAAGLAMTASLSATSISQGYQDATAAALGNTGAAGVGTSAAVYYNPAALTRLDSAEAQFTFFGSFGETNFSNGPLNTDTSSDFVATGSLFAGLPVEALGGVVGFGVTTPHGLGIEYPDSSPLRSVALEGELAHVVYTLSYARKLTDGLSLGLGIDYARDELRTRQGLVAPGDFLEAELDGSGFGFNVGLLYEPHPDHSFGLVYQSKMSVGLSGDLETDAPLLLPVPVNESARSSFRYPDKLVLGHSWQATEKTRIETNLTWYNWDSLNSVSIRTPTQTLTNRFDHDPGLILNFGINHRVNDCWTLNCGYLYGEKTAPSNTFVPTIPDADLHVFSIGAEYSRNDWSVAAAGLFVFREDRTVAGSPASPFTGVSADGDYETDGQAFLITVRRKF